MTTIYASHAYGRAAQEDRSAPRFRAEIPATLRPSGSSGFATRVTDLSLSGFACQAVTGMHTGALCWLSIGPCKGLQAEVVWNDGATVGCAFATLLNPAVLDAIVSAR